MNDVVVFVGPSLALAEARATLPAIYLPPAAQGDVYRAALDRPWGIAIIDGCFERLPAVWHKEILWAMSQGVHVFGAASMGALRAAELAPFGMVGVGRIFEAFRSGALTDDDEVTIAHGEADSGYRAASVAMVDIRATLERAEHGSVITSATHERLLAIAKNTYYPERSYAGLCAQARMLGLPAGELAALAAWLPASAVAQKSLDALELLATVRETQRAHPGRRGPVGYQFEHTEAWEQVVRRFGREGIAASAAAESDLDRIVEELRLEPDAYQRVREGALLRALALESAERRGVSVDAALLQQTVDALRREHELFDRPSVDRWLADQELDLSGFAALLQRAARARVVEAAHAADGRRNLLDQLRLRGEYGRLVRRSRDKQRCLRERGIDVGQPIEPPLPEPELTAWYRRRVGACFGENLDLAAHQLGYGDRHSMLQAIAREYIYERDGREGSGATKSRSHSL